MIKYLLLLENSEGISTELTCAACSDNSRSMKNLNRTDSAQFQVIRKLAGELLFTKFNKLVANWEIHALDRASSISSELFIAMFSSNLIALLFLEHVIDKGAYQDAQVWSKQSSDTINEMLAYAIDTDAWPETTTTAYMTQILQSVQPLLPPCRTFDLTQFSSNSPRLSLLLSKIGRLCIDRPLSTSKVQAEIGDDMMDSDQEDSTQASQKQVDEVRNGLPRDMLGLVVSRSTAFAATSSRLVLLHEISKGSDVSGMVPHGFYDYVAALSMENFVFTSGIIIEVLQSDFVTEDIDATKLMTQLAELLSSHAFTRCEVVMVLCLDVLVGLGSRWMQIDDIEGSLSEVASQIYRYFIETGLERQAATTEVLKHIVDMLFLLIRMEPDYGTKSGLSSPKASLFAILGSGQTSVRFYAGKRLHEIFGQFLLADHDKLFLDILETLPSDTNWLEMMALRMYVLASLASKWSNLLRRCIYHIVEIPGKSKITIPHASHCLTEIANALRLHTSRDILALFAPQLLFTWVDNEAISDLPYEVFGFSNLREFIENVQDELAGLLTMRAQDDRLEEIASILGIEQKTLLERSFTKVMSYAIGQDAKGTKLGATSPATIVSKVRAKLGQDLYYKSLNLHFVEIVALSFSLIDQESDIERYFRRSKDLTPAADIYAAIRSLGTSNTVLPPNQQPMFSGKIFSSQMSILCSQTAFVHSTLYTPTLLTYMARRLLSSMHFALGSLHSCSILRKLRILISLAGNAALSGYPLEMLLHSMHPFLIDAECTDDAIGLVKYLLEGGSEHLSKNPSFVAGLGLSYLGRLRIFLRSTQSSTTQESQFKSTMSAAQDFRIWFGKYLKRYESPGLRTQVKNSFEVLLDSAYDAEFIGNVELGNSESNLLFQLLRDERKNVLLSRSSRRAALNMLCSEFQLPSSFRKDIFGRDSLSMLHAEVVWKSCHGQTVSNDYLSWAGRVLGRAFAASGEIHNRLSREFSLRDWDEIDTNQSSAANVLQLLQDLTLDVDSRTVGLAEVALRLIISSSAEDPSSNLQQNVSTQLYMASQWTPYQIPPSEEYVAPPTMWVKNDINDMLSAGAILYPNWLQNLCLGVAHSSPNSHLLKALPPILQAEPSFAERMFPFILHLSLSISDENHNFSKKKLSKAFGGWLEQNSADNTQNVRILLNAILYLRTQPMVNEKSSAERARWLDIDYFQAAKAAIWCGMPKTALLFVEEIGSTQVKSSRRSSAMAEPAKVTSGLLLSIFENIDDPDMYYGVEQPATLQSILARLEYEKDGAKSLAFRGAQYDSHVRQNEGTATTEIFSLVKSLDVLNQSGLSHALLQNQQTVGMTTESMSSMFHTARKLEQWDLPVPTIHQSNQVTIYKTFQALHTAKDRTKLTLALNEGLETTMRHLVGKSLSANALHESLQTLASLTEADEVISSQSSEDFEEMLARFDQRSAWMKTGRSVLFIQQYIW